MGAIHSLIAALSSPLRRHLSRGCGAAVLRRFLSPLRGGIARFVAPPVAALMASVLLSPAHADVIELRADQWCPYTCRPDSDQPGVLVEITREALAPFGHELHYALLSRARGISQVQAGEIDGLLGLRPGDHPGLLFGPPLSHSQEALGFRLGESRDVTHPQDLQGLRLGALQDQVYSDPFARYLGRHRNDPTLVQLLSGAEGLRRNLKKLLNNRIDLVLEDRAVLQHTLKQRRLRRQVEVVPLPGQIPLHVGFAPGQDSSVRYIAQLEQGLARLKRSGRYQAILARYGLKG